MLVRDYLYCRRDNTDRQEVIRLSLIYFVQSAPAVLEPGS